MYFHANGDSGIEKPSKKFSPNNDEMTFLKIGYSDSSVA